MEVSGQSSSSPCGRSYGSLTIPPQRRRASRELQLASASSVPCNGTGQRHRKGDRQTSRPATSSSPMDPSASDLVAAACVEAYGHGSVGAGQSSSSPCGRSYGSLTIPSSASESESWNSSWRRLPLFPCNGTGRSTERVIDNQQTGDIVFSPMDPSAGVTCGSGERRTSLPPLGAAVITKGDLDSVLRSVPGKEQQAEDSDVRTAVAEYANGGGMFSTAEGRRRAFFVKAVTECFGGAA
nr:hypothetical protein Iba_chr07dCG5400 [Ipomoea batatas]